MSSILTNNGAMVALQTLKSVNNNLLDVQSQISTGKKVANAKDNAAVWAISKVMESDVKGFKAISESLSLGESTVAVARAASETVTDLLTEMKSKIVAAQEDNVDRAKINTDVTALKEQIASVVSAAQFNGLNLVNNNATVSVLSSLDRDNTGAVTASSIDVTGQDLSTAGYTAKAVFTGSENASTPGDTFGGAIDNAASANIVIADPGGLVAGDKLNVQIGDKSFSYTFSATDVAAGNAPEEIAAANLKTQIAAEFDAADLTVIYDPGANAGTITLTNNNANSIAISGHFESVGAGGLSAIDSIDVSSSGGAAAALGTIETLINTSIDAAAEFGSAAGRLETQADFISKLSDSMTSGIGSLVDADMEEASARLQALQTQQQLGVQALSIANQAPQSIMQLFR